jgi:hypothetical protein
MYVSTLLSIKRTPKQIHIKIWNLFKHFFLNWYWGGGVQLGPLDTTATNRPIVPAPDDYDDGEIGGMMIGTGNRSTRRKLEPVPLCPPQTPYALAGCEPGPPRWEASDLTA